MVDNVVSVRGELDSVERKGLAVACIQKTDGVKKFIDLISVNPIPEDADHTAVGRVLPRDESATP